MKVRIVPIWYEPGLDMAQTACQSVDDPIGFEAWTLLHAHK